MKHSSVYIIEDLSQGRWRVHCKHPNDKRLWYPLTYPFPCPSFCPSFLRFST